MAKAKENGSKLNRRGFLGAGVAVTVGAGACDNKEVASECLNSSSETQPHVPLPPLSSPRLKVLPTACDYCIVGCAYNVYAWPVDEAGTNQANGYHQQYPSGSGESWAAPQMHNVVEIDGVDHNVVVIPDNGEFVNRGGDFSVRGGTLAQKLYKSEGPTSDRLKMPRIRLGEQFYDIPWDQAIELVAQLSRHTIDHFGAAAWAMKHFSYHYYENTYALTKFALGAVETPAWAVHDKPSSTSDAPGLSDAGVYAFNYSYQDWHDSEVIFISGVSLYDAKSILFQDWVMTGGATLIVVNPRRDMTAAWAEENGGLFLQIRPGTDTVLHNALARYIHEQGWEDREFISSRVATAEDIETETKWRRRKFAMGHEAYVAYLMSDDAYSIAGASQITGIPQAQLIAAAQLMAAPDISGRRPKTSFMLEKGNYWAHNYDNTASFVSLGLITGAGGRPGQVIGRAGGHQRGMIKGASYPIEKSPDEFEGNKVGLNLDRWVSEGQVRLMWVVGTTWFAAMAASQSLAARVYQLTRNPGLAQLHPGLLGPDQRLDLATVLAVLKQRMAQGGMVLVDQDVYPNRLSEGFADIVLPAAGWGEEDFTRMQGERRLRMYSKFMEPPGQAKPDWWIISKVATAMGYSGFAWPNANAVFEEAAEHSEGGAHAYKRLVDVAHAQGMTGHEYLRSISPDGVQCPLKAPNARESGLQRVPGIRETKRLHDESFSTKSGRAILVKGSWARVQVRHRAFEPTGDELWVTNKRVNRLWQSLYDDRRIPYRIEGFPTTLVEIHPQDAGTRGIQHGDWVDLINDHVPDQHGKPRAAKVRAVAQISEDILPGVTCCYFNYDGDVESATNSLTHGTVDPASPIYAFKLGKARVVRVGPSESPDRISYGSQALAR